MTRKVWRLPLPALALFITLNQITGLVGAEGLTDTLERGRAIWNFHCYFCHGYSGDAATLAASYLDPPPRNFRATPQGSVSQETMIDVVTNGRAGTAMKGFEDRLTNKDIVAVVKFIRDEFILGDRDNTRYHTAENGWPDHERYAPAFPFATGDLPLDTPWEVLTPEQADGKRLFLASCVTCHDRARVTDPGPSWDSRPLSYPRAGYSHRSDERIDATSGATPYAIHDRPPTLPDSANSVLLEGEKLYQANCAFCHAADGTGKNWIGQFMEPHPRNLTIWAATDDQQYDTLLTTIREGLPGTAMPAWRRVLGDDEIAAVATYVMEILAQPQHEQSLKGMGHAKTK